MGLMTDAASNKTNKVVQKPTIDAAPPEKPHDPIVDPVTPSVGSNNGTQQHGRYIESIRRNLKRSGTITTNYRTTPENKEALAQLVWDYKRRKISTSENELVRIAIEFVLADFEDNGEQSVVHTVLELLHT